MNFHCFYCLRQKIGGFNMLEVNFFEGAKMERTACAMGKRGPPLAYAILIGRIIIIINYKSDSWLDHVLTS